ncbi:MAG TPA: 2-C-methyl-D-erythritol 2,4-cyclodiphosphate synthase, partial [Desulfobacteraceae bacterium]|nr:2-C-methyl-D-erythritol 2,4-cyclodiphosphate synthase [Desulfobacteraceae bacterium]
AYKGISSSRLLAECLEKIRGRGFSIANMDCTIFAQAPKMSPHKEEMTGNIAAILGLDRDRVNVKATTTETLGFVGRKEGIAAQATVLLYT